MRVQASPGTVAWIVWFWWMVANVCGCAVAGAIFGILQWRTLRRQILWSGWWLLGEIVDKGSRSRK